MIDPVYLLADGINFTLNKILNNPQEPTVHTTSTNHFVHFLLLYAVQRLQLMHDFQVFFFPGIKRLRRVGWDSGPGKMPG